ncbi:hypothetical protein [Burkholderia cenocepacia]|uniref:hypothetical protein n=1 Tax=Burkholderia cenocepacia TaxID=95486 RepID=UPI0009809B80|nr:hypothetical protein [Burkholderia cenocepacia]AQQ43254.1 hypothetical protein A8E75_30570 [Burkholderia cenocepacia]ONV25280.1 hypothetical protein A8E74_09650 [Burkholderia cenocepacia]ONV30596.1 hypothetical protein A8E78_17475 [Burkholderia cenocepacia]ONV33443.1 hypothetical protein A8E77_15815 [Burkholderia cenocepacia]ONV55294.1 hypothetical protein A8E81_10665 [Burkholderia cenocepacia]
MSKAKYMYAWKDDDDVYVNKAESIEEIIEGIIEYYDEDAEEVIIAQHDGKFTVRFVVDYDGYDRDWHEMEFGEIEEIEREREEGSFQVHCEFEATPWTASQFLDALARVYGRQDQFDISENN